MSSWEFRTESFWVNLESSALLKWAHDELSGAATAEAATATAAETETGSAAAAAAAAAATAEEATAVATEVNPELVGRKLIRCECYSNNSVDD